MLAPLALKGDERGALPMTICDNYLIRICGNSVLYGSLSHLISVLVKFLENLSKTLLVNV